MLTKHSAFLITRKAHVMHLLHSAFDTGPGTSPLSEMFRQNQWVKLMYTSR